MDAGEVDTLIDLLREREVVLAPGLTDAEVDQVEQTYGFHFPPDLRALLQQALPVSQGFPDWRNGAEVVLRERLDWPADGICFDIEHNAFCRRMGAAPAEPG